MPRTRLRAPHVPLALRGSVLLDDHGRPRYWSTVWSSLDGAALGETTLARHLDAIELLYASVKTQTGSDQLDRLITDTELDAIESCLTGFFVAQRNRSERSNAKWSLAVGFVRQCLLRISKSADSTERRFGELDLRLRRLDQLYLSLRMPAKKRPEPIRALSSDVVADLYEIIPPDAPRNPFRTPALRWRNFTLILLLLHQGLRRSEALMLPVDALKHEWRTTRGVTQYWLNVAENPDAPDDPRADAPSLKNVFAQRQIPASNELARTLELYLQNYRGRQAHSFLFTSQTGAPLSKRSVSAICKVLTAALSPEARAQLKSFNNAERLRAHDFRHTCAVMRLTQFLDSGLEMDVAVQKLRVLFGWSRASTMPMRYARAYFEHALATVWNDKFSVHVDALRSLETERS